MQPNSNWQPDQNSGQNESQHPNQYEGQTLQQIENSVRVDNPRTEESLEDRRVPNVTINPAVAASVQPSPQDYQAPIDTEVVWEAKEYITADKNVAWYIGLGIVVVAVVLLDIFILKAITVSILMVVIAIVLVVITVRPPEVLRYRIDNDGIHMNDKVAEFTDYKAFGLFKEGDTTSIMLIPVKRFLPALSIYFPEEKSDEIVSILSRRLPNYEVKPDFMDRIVRILRIY